MLSPRMTDKVMSEGHVGTRITWVRINGPVCNIFFIVVYIPHKGRKQKPMTQDTDTQLKSLLQSIRKTDSVILGGDFNCQLQRNVSGCTGQWCMTEKPNRNGHGDEILSLLREHDLCAVDTYFKPQKKRWQGKQRRCNATYLPKGSLKRPTKLDYLCVSNRWKSMILDCKVRWQRSIALARNLIMGV